MLQVLNRLPLQGATKLVYTKCAVLSANKVIFLCKMLKGEAPFNVGR